MDTTATNGVLYYYEVAAVNAGGISPVSNETSATPSAADLPSAPSGLTAVPQNGQVGLTWNSALGAVTYSVFRGTSSGGESGTAIATGVTGTSYADTSVVNNSTYYYKVESVNSAGTSGASNEASATPLSTSPTAAAAAFESTDTTTLGAWRGSYGVDGFIIANDTSLSNPTYPSWLSSGASPTFTGSTVLSWLSPLGGSPYSTMPPQQYPIELEAADTGSVNATLGAWSSPTSFTVSNINVVGGTQQIALYLYDEPAAGQAARAETITIQDATSHVTLSQENVSGAGFEGGEYLAWNVSGSVNIIVTGTSGPNSVLSGIFFGGALSGGVPAQPTKVAAVAGNGPLTVSWAPLNTIQTYNVYRGTSSGGETLLANNVTAATYQDTAVAANTRYYYTVNAVNSLGTSQTSAEVSAIQTTAPLAPTVLVAAGGQLYWTPSNGAATYNVYRSTTPGGEGTTALATGITISTATNDTITDGGYFDSTATTTGTTYYYKVAAVNTSGTSSESMEASFVYGAPVLPAVQSFATLGPAPNEASVSWMPVPGALSYVICRSSDSVASPGTIEINPEPIAIVQASQGNAAPYSYTDPNEVQGLQYSYGVVATGIQGSSTPTGGGSAGTSVIPAAVTGQIYPKYQVLSVLYSPPGSGSDVIYGTSNLVGTTTSNTNSYALGITLSESETTGVDIAGFAGGSETNTANQAWNWLYGSNGSTSISTTTATSVEAYGTAQSNLHDADQIVVWLNPQLNFSLNAESTSEFGHLSNPAGVTFTQYGYNTLDPLDSMDVLYIPVGYLDGDYGAIPSNVQTLLNRPWAGANADGSGPALTTADLQSILTADPFTSSSYTPTFVDGSSTSSDGRYTNVGNVNYTGLTNNHYTGSLTYVNTTTSGSSTSYAFTSGLSFDATIKASMGVTGPASKLFDIFVSAELKNTYSWVWTNTTSSLLTDTNSLSDAYTIVGPGTGYTGPPIYGLFQDNVYGTFMFLPETD